MKHIQDAKKLRALADSSRWKVVLLLLEGPRTVGDLNAHIGIEQSLLSHHLKILRDEGLVERERQGKRMLYRLARQVRLIRGRKGIDLGCCRILMK
jgi:ArsR family transcriptional regulator